VEKSDNQMNYHGGGGVIRNLLQVDQARYLQQQYSVIQETNTRVEMFQNFVPSTSECVQYKEAEEEKQRDDKIVCSQTPRILDYSSYLNLKRQSVPETTMEIAIAAFRLMQFKKSGIGVGPRYMKALNDISNNRPSQDLIEEELDEDYEMYQCQDLSGYIDSQSPPKVKELSTTEMDERIGEKAHYCVCKYCGLDTRPKCLNCLSILSTNPELKRKLVIRSKRAKKKKFIRRKSIINAADVKISETTTTTQVTEIKSASKDSNIARDKLPVLELVPSSSSYHDETIVDQTINISLNTSVAWNYNEAIDFTW
jgi:hypothetical protein